MPFEIVRNDITNMHVDVIVNTANPRPVIGSGVDAAIHAKAGPMLLASRKLIGIINTGDAQITPGFNAPAKYIIHTVGPIWNDGAHGEARLLRKCYNHSLQLALRHNCESIAFPLISTGNYGFPKRLALETAIDAIRAFLKKHDILVYLVVFDKDSYAVSAELADHVRSYIDEAEYHAQWMEEHRFSSIIDLNTSKSESWEPEEIVSTLTIPSNNIPHREKPTFSPAPHQTKSSSRRMSSIYDTPALPEEKPLIIPIFDPEELAEMIADAEVGFSETLLRLIDSSGQKDSEIYKRANIDRKLFSKIRNNPQYKPSKTTAVAFAIALELDLEETRDFIGRAGYALSRSNKFDIIIEYFITHKRYDIYEINMMLFEFDQLLLGA